jgi:hypothetical protein
MKLKAQHIELKKVADGAKAGGMWYFEVLPASCRLRGYFLEETQKHNGGSRSLLFRYVSRCGRAGTTHGKG